MNAEQEKRLKRTYLTRPYLVEAEQWIDAAVKPPAPDTLVRWVVDQPFPHVRGGERQGHWELRTVQGWVTLDVGDYIVNNIAKEYYPVKPATFEAYYEAVAP